MSMTTVSRRVVTIKMKKTARPHVPLPRRSANDAMVGEGARQFEPFAVRTAPIPVIEPWWLQKAVRKGIMLLIGATVCCGLAYLVLKGTGSTSYDAPPRIESLVSRPSSVESSPRRPGRSAASAGGQEQSRNAAHTESTAVPTDTSFLATAYVRRKVSLPNISGDCTVKDSGNGDVGECLRRQLVQ